MQFVTNNVRRSCALMLVIGVLWAGLPVARATDAPVKIESDNFGIESFFFGSTGVVFSFSASIPPVITSGPTVSAITEFTANVSWTTDKSASSAVYIGTTSGTYTNQIGNPNNVLTFNHSVTLNGLNRGTTYYYKVRSVDIDGNAVESAEGSFQTDPGDITAPVITLGPLISIDSASLVTISWETDEPASSLVEYGVNGVTENTVGRPDERTLFHQVKIAGLTPSQSYVWRVRSSDADGNTVTSDTQELATPNSPFISGFTITDITLTSAVVQWNTSTASSTIVEYGTSSADYTTRIVDENIATSHTVRLTELESGTIYYLRVSGLDPAGNLLQSDEKVFATIVVPVITELTISEITENSALVTWKSSSPIDELVRYEIKNHPDPDQVGRRFSAGNDQLVTIHALELLDLESSSTYDLSVLGKDIFGNQASSNTISFTTLVDSTAPSIFNIRSDTTIDLGSRQTVQVIVSFELSELGKAVIEYGPGASGPYDKKIETDIFYSRAKLMVIPGLQPGQSYHFKIVATDRSGNNAESPDYLVLAPKQQLSLLDLIFGQIRENFGWLRNL